MLIIKFNPDCSEAKNLDRLMDELVDIHDKHQNCLITYSTPSTKEINAFKQLVTDEILTPNEIRFE